MATETSTRRKPPIRCTPCLVTYEGMRYHVHSDGRVFFYAVNVMADGSREGRDGSETSDSLAVTVRRHASRLRRNRNARERNQAMRDLGMKRTREGGWE